MITAVNDSEEVLCTTEFQLNEVKQNKPDTKYTPKEFPILDLINYIIENKYGPFPNPKTLEEELSSIAKLLKGKIVNSVMYGLYKNMQYKIYITDRELVLDNMVGVWDADYINPCCKDDSDRSCHIAVYKINPKPIPLSDLVDGREVYA